MPAVSRASKPQPPAEDKDAIVTVGRPKEKKRKRAKTADAGAPVVADAKGKGREMSSPVEDATAPASSAEAKESDKPFDYSAVPNGLDQVVKQDNPNKLKKAKKVKKREFLKRVCSVSAVVPTLDIDAVCTPVLSPL